MKEQPISNADRVIPEGKLNIEQLKELIFKYIERYSPGRQEILRHPYIGEDCAVIDPAHKQMVLSSDPITGATENIGRLGVMVNLNDIASAGGDPLGIMVTLLCPLGTTEKEVATIMEDIAKTAGESGVQVLGGHTEVTSGVNRTILSITVIGTKSEMDVALSEIDSWDIYMTKEAGLEGFYIISNERADVLTELLEQEDWEILRGYEDQLSVVADARLARGFHPALMHDVTEGGVFGALWEVCQLMRVGAIIEEENLPLSVAGKKIAHHFGIDPWRLISSGCLLFLADPCYRQTLEQSFREAGITLSRLGRTTKQESILLSRSGQLVEIEPPCSDELYKVL